MRRILCLYLPDWPIQRVLAGRKKKDEGRRTKDEVRSVFRTSSFVFRPLLLHARDPRRGDVVVAANSAACERGVRLNMPLAEAAALAQHGGECCIEPHHPEADLAELARLAEHCERFSPIVGWNTAGKARSAECGVRNAE